MKDIESSFHLYEYLAGGWIRRSNDDHDVYADAMYVCMYYRTETPCIYQ